jgi:hypothetical protein
LSGSPFSWLKRGTREAAGGGERQAASGEPEVTYSSHALEALALEMERRESMHLLDLGGASQANLSFVTGMNHRLYCEDLLRARQQHLAGAELAGENAEALIERFLDETIDFPDQSTDGILLWDVLQFLPHPLVLAAVERIYRILAPDSLIVSFFHPEHLLAQARPQACRILDRRTISLRPRNLTPEPLLFNTRDMERLFERFSLVRFYLTRGNLQEVLVKR